MSENKVFVLRELDKIKSVTDYLNSKNYKSNIKELDKKVIESNYYQSKQLEIPLASKIFSLSRLRYVNDEPKSIENTYIDYSFTDGMENFDYNDVSFYAVLLKEKGLSITRSEEEIMIVEGTDRECELLGLPLKSEVLLIKGRRYVNDEKPFEYFEVVCEPSFYQFRSVTRL